MCEKFEKWTEWTIMDRMDGQGCTLTGTDIIDKFDEVDCCAIGDMWVPCFAPAQPSTPLRNDMLTVRARREHCIRKWEREEMMGGRLCTQGVALG
jgi:hypothetical protein